MLREGQVAAKERSVDVTVDGGQFGVTVQHGVQGGHVVDGSLEGRPHGIDDECRARRVELLLQFLGNHAPHGVALHQPRLQVLQVRQSHVRVVCLVAHVEYGRLSCLLLQVVGAEVDAVVVAVGAAVGDKPPFVVGIEVVERSEELDDLALEHLRRHLPGRIGKRVAGIVQVHQVDTRRIVPLVEAAQWRYLVKGVAEILGERLPPNPHPLV